MFLPLHRAMQHAVLPAKLEITPKKGEGFSRLLKRPSVPRKIAIHALMQLPLLVPCAQVHSGRDGLEYMQIDFFPEYEVRAGQLPIIR